MINFPEIDLRIIIKEIFYKYIANISKESYFIEEKIEQSPPEIDWGDVLYLSLTSIDKKKCNVKLYIYESYCHVYIGKNLEKVFDPYFIDINQCPKIIEDLMYKILYGGISKKIWKFKKTILYEITMINSENYTNNSDLIYKLLPLRKWFFKLFSYWIIEVDIPYEPYVVNN